jgi:hypothetical protein
MKSHEESRAKRKEKMTSWFGESIGKWLGWSPEGILFELYFYLKAPNIIL